MTDTLKLQNLLLSAPGSTGAEEKRARLIAELCAPLCDEVTVDPMFNVIARRKGAGPRAMLAAHMDTLGVMVTFIEESGFLRFERVGGIRPMALIDTVIEFENGVLGKAARVSDARNSKIKMGEISSDELYIDIGARSREEAQRLVPAGSVGHYHGSAFTTGDRIVSPYLDDLISCVAQIQAMEELQKVSCPNDIYFVFSTQEEIGHRGARAAAQAIGPDWGFAVDVTPTGDRRGEKRQLEVSIGGGPAICSKNGSVIVDPKMARYMRRVSREAGIPFQEEIMPSGGTDAEAIQHARAGALAGGLGIPTRDIHTPSESASLKDIELTVKLICELLKKDPRQGGVL